MTVVNWTVSGSTLAIQAGWLGDGSTNPFSGLFYIDEAYDDTDAAGILLAGSGFSGTINSATLTIPRGNDNNGTNGTVRLRLVAENSPTATNSPALNTRTYRTAYVEFTLPSDAVTINLDVTALIQDLLTAGYTYTGTQKIIAVIAGSSAAAGWGSNASVSWRSLWQTSNPPSLSIDFTTGGGSFTADVSETVTIGESLSSTASYLANTSETITVSDAVSGLFSGIAAINESVTFTDSVDASTNASPPTYSREVTMSAVGYVDVDFGAEPGVNSLDVAVTGQTAITATSYAEAFFMADSTTGGSQAHTVEDHCWANVFCAATCSACTAGVGFTIYLRSLEKMTGKYRLRFTWAD